MVFYALMIVAVVGVLTWLSVNPRLPRLGAVLRSVLLTVAIASTTLLVASTALFFILSRSSADSPAAAVPLMLGTICAFVAVPCWIGFVLQARLRRG